MFPPINNWRERQTEHRFHGKIAKDIITRNSERKGARGVICYGCLTIQHRYTVAVSIIDGGKPEYLERTNDLLKLYQEHLAINVREYRRGNQESTIQRIWQHRVHRTKKNKTNA
jgi:hypothetical protein